ncbi:MAG: PAS domain S-box protein [Bacillota bacterium]
MDLLQLEQEEAQAITKEALFRGAFENGPVGRAIETPDGTILQVNDALCRLLGYTQEEFRHGHCREITHPDDLEAENQLLQRLMAGEIDHFDLEKRFIHKQGHEIWGAVSAVMVRDRAGQAQFIVSQVIDLTDQKRAQEGLDSFFEISMDLLCITDLHHRLQRTNPAMQSFLGLPDSELVGRTTLDFIHPDDLEDTVRKADSFKKGHQTVYVENRYRRGDGEYRWIAWNAVLVRGSDLIYSVGMDITDLKRNNAAMAYLASIVQASENAIIGADLEMRIRSWNNGAARMYGYQPDEAIGNFMDLLAPADRRGEFYRIAQRVLAGEAVANYVTIRQRKDGTTLDIALTCSPIRDRDGRVTGFAIVHHDITDQKRVERRLISSEQRFYKAFHSSPLPNGIITTKGVIIDINEGFCRQTGYSRDEVIGVSIDDLWGSAGDEWLTRAVAEHEAENLETRLPRKDGTMATVLVTTSRVELDGQDCLLVTAVDITERSRMMEEMMRLDRLNLVGQMAAGIGHEIRNPMTTVRGFLQLLGDKEECQPYREFFTLMIAELDRANGIISEYLSLARSKPVELRMGDLNQMIEAVRPMIEADALLRGKAFAVDLGSVPQIMLDAKEIRQLVLNLVRNGLEASPEGGEVRLCTRSEAGAVVMTIQDHGQGIPPEIVAKLGTPFVTTKDNGTGLGLPVCYSIANRHNATIHVETGTSGTTFTINFPVSVQRSVGL